MAERFNVPGFLKETHEKVLSEAARKAVSVWTDHGDGSMTAPGFNGKPGIRYWPTRTLGPPTKNNPLIMIDGCPATLF